MLAAVTVGVDEVEEVGMMMVEVICTPVLAAVPMSVEYQPQPWLFAVTTTFCTRTISLLRR